MGSYRHLAGLARETMVVLDASVILKWLLPETGSENALRFRDQHISGEERIIVPSLVFYEIANVLRYHTKISDEELVSLFEIFNDLELIAINPAFSDMTDTMLYARHKNVSVYDAVYVVLAKRLDCSLVTADERLARMVNEPFVTILV
ncbi:MAG: type II toxin-antitoxin system VapC family toxin [Candidatus Colwellbacteria bacterium]|nr:type II toxin-antitoxin system VapC family toxin [Candidatus Colwellbacteria bacterium]